MPLVNPRIAWDGEGSCHVMAGWLEQLAEHAPGCRPVGPPPSSAPCSFPGSDGEQQRAKRRRVEGGGSDEDEEEEEQEECTGGLTMQLLPHCCRLG